MKKIYMIPQTKVVNVATTEMMALSAVLDKNQSITSSDEFGVRQSAFDWDDEEDY